MIPEERSRLPLHFSALSRGGLHCPKKARCLLCNFVHRTLYRHMQR